jgi:hypothetical protein
MTVCKGFANVLLLQCGKSSAWMAVHAAANRGTGVLHESEKIPALAACR